jgi:hypothetical protein
MLVGVQPLLVTLPHLFGMNGSVEVESAYASCTKGGHVALAQSNYLSQCMCTGSTSSGHHVVLAQHNYLSRKID